MAYTPLGWVSKESADFDQTTSPKINADNLKHMENGIIELENEKTDKTDFNELKSYVKPFTDTGGFSVFRDIIPSGYSAANIVGTLGNTIFFTSVDGHYNQGVFYTLNTQTETITEFGACPQGLMSRSGICIADNSTLYFAEISLGTSSSDNKSVTFYKYAKDSTSGEKIGNKIELKGSKSGNFSFGGIRVVNNVIQFVYSCGATSTIKSYMCTYDGTTFTILNNPDYSNPYILSGVWQILQNDWLCDTSTYRVYKTWEPSTAPTNYIQLPKNTAVHSPIDENRILANICGCGGIYNVSTQSWEVLFPLGQLILVDNGQAGACNSNYCVVGDYLYIGIGDNITCVKLK